MNGLGGQVMQGVADVGRKVPLDVMKGVTDVGKNTVTGTVEALTGMNMNPQTQQQGADKNVSEEQRIARLKMENSQAAQARLNQVRQELEGYSSRKRQEETQRTQVVEQQHEERKDAEEKQKESKRASFLRNLVKRATKGTGERSKNKN